MSVHFYILCIARAASHKTITGNGYCSNKQYLKFKWSFSFELNRLAATTKMNKCPHCMTQATVVFPTSILASGL